jgi:amidase
MLKRTTKTAFIAAQAAFISFIPVSALAAVFRLEEATIADINAAFDAGALTSEELVNLYINRIETYDSSGTNINSIRTLNPNVINVAEALDKERQTTGARSPLHGIPILLKDNFDTFDMPTTGGSAALRGSIPPDDAYVVDKLRDAGAIIFGKTNLDEFAISGSGYSSISGLTRNPYKLNRTSGGSSGGSGAAIGANFATIGTGSDTGGSIRTPSSYQSLVTVRPTRGLVSLDGIIPFTLSRDGIGPMARNVTDAATTLGIMAGFDPNNPSFSTAIAAPTVQPDKFYTDYTQFLDRNSLKGARIGVVRNYLGFENGVDPQVSALTENAIATMEGLGATTVDINFSEDFISTLGITYPIAAAAEQKPYLEDYLATLGPGYPKTIEELIAILESPEVANSDTPSIIIDSLIETAESEGLTDADYLDVAQNLTPFVRSTLVNTLDSNDIDAFLFPTVRTFAPPLLGTEDPTFVSPDGAPPARSVEFASSTGLPDITVPAGFSDDGLPMTISLTGRPYDESTLIGLAYAFEQATNFRRPSSLVPALPGEVIEYEDESVSVAEPSLIPALMFLGVGVFGVRLVKRRQITGGNSEREFLSNLPIQQVRKKSS